MRESFERYPEVLLVDDTYKLNNHQMPLYAFLVEDGNGQSEIAPLYLVGSEDVATLEEMSTSF